MSTLQRYNQYISAVLNATGTFTANLTCPFVPDEIKVTNLSFYHNGTTPDVFTVQVNLGNGNSPGGTAIGAIIDPIVALSRIIVPLVNFTNGTYTFGVYENNVLSTALNGATLDIMLEFRRYRR